MKAEHRKELQTNVLADSIGRFWLSLKAAPSSTTIAIWVFILLAVGLVVLWQYWYRANLATNSAVWVKVENAASLEDLNAIIAKDPNSRPARTARFLKARLLLRQGLEQLCGTFEKEREEALTKVKEAGELYQKLAVESTDNRLLMQEAWLGTAVAKETQGDLKEALEDYRKVAAEKPESDITKKAAEHAERLAQGDTKIEEFYARLKELNNPKPLPPPPAPTP
jgi:tetratricopeptide (TPR) repeat protein